MDWLSCQKNRMVKETKPDVNMINSLIIIADEKIKSADILPENHYYAKITLLYDVIRGYLEKIALQKGYKIYNHECYTAFLKEILKESYLADEFDKYRIIRNGINYYGRKINLEEGCRIIKNMHSYINKIKVLIELKK